MSREKKNIDNKYEYEFYLDKIIQIKTKTKHSLMLLASWLVLSNRSHQVMTPLLFSGLFLGWRPKCYLFIIHHKPFRLISSWLGPSTSWSSISASVEIMEKLKSFDLVVYILGKKWKKLRFISSLCL